MAHIHAHTWLKEGKMGFLRGKGGEPVRSKRWQQPHQMLNALNYKNERRKWDPSTRRKMRRFFSVRNMMIILPWPENFYRNFSFFYPPHTHFRWQKELFRKFLGFAAHTLLSFPFRNHTIIVICFILYPSFVSHPFAPNLPSRTLLLLKYFSLQLFPIVQK